MSTYLSRLVRKKFLTAQKDGRVFYYEPIISRLEYQQSILNETLNKKVGNSIEGIVAAFCGIADASDEDLKTSGKQH
ncbi:MAG: BlaI/MecI/CopY family transcriptional regulator [Clostridium sp.]